MSQSSTSRTFTPFIEKNGVAILDGGMTTSLPPEAGQHVLWGIQLLFSHSGLDTLYNVHYKFLDAGADAIETLSYKLSAEIIKQCEDHGYIEELRENIMNSNHLDWIHTGVDAETKLPTMDELYNRSIGTAIRARNDFVRKNGVKLSPLVIGCLGPYDDACKMFYGQSDPKSSSRKDSTLAIEKSNNLRKLNDIEINGMHHYYRQKLTGMILNTNIKPDMVQFETLPSVKEALIALEELSWINDKLEMIIPCNVTFIPHPIYGPDRINRGDHVADAVEEVIRFINGNHSKPLENPTFKTPWQLKDDNSQKSLNVLLTGIGCNCMNPNMTNTIAEIIKDAIDETYDELQISDDILRPEIIVYPNSGEVYDARPEHRGWKFDSEEDMKVLDGNDAREYYEHGATVIGGCCRVKSDQIKLFATELKK